MSNLYLIWTLRSIPIGLIMFVHLFRVKPKIFKPKISHRNPNFSPINFLTSLSCIPFFLLPVSTFYQLYTLLKIPLVYRSSSSFMISLIIDVYNWCLSYFDDRNIIRIIINGYEMFYSCLFWEKWVGTVILQIEFVFMNLV